MPNYKHISKGR